MREKRWMALALAWTLLLGGCAERPPETTPTPLPTSTGPQAKDETGEVEFALPWDPAEGSHPITGTNGLNLTLAPLLYRGLFSVGRDFQAREDLCEGYTVSEDGLSWTFRLGAAEFSDGTPVTAQEVVASLELARQNDRYAGRLRDVKTIGAEGETVVVTLNRPNGALPVLLDIPIVKEGTDPRRPLGAGTYVLQGDEEFRLVARQGAQTPLPVIPLRTVRGGDELVYAFDAGEIALVDTDLTGTNALGYSGRLETIDYPTTTLLYFGCNLQKGLCREQSVRQAIALLLDREEITRRCLAGHAVATALPVHPSLPGYDASLERQWQEDPEKAKELLEEGGWTAGEEGVLTRKRETLELRILVNQDNTFKTAAAQAAARKLEEAGFRVTVERLAWEEFAAALEKGDFDLYLGETALTADFDLEPLLGAGGALNYMGFWDGTCQEQMDAYRASTGAERETTLVNLCAAVAELAPVIPLCFKNGSLLIQWGQVTGARPAQRNIFADLEDWRIHS